MLTSVFARLCSVIALMVALLVGFAPGGIGVRTAHATSFHSPSCEQRTGPNIFTCTLSPSDKQELKAACSQELTLNGPLCQGATPDQVADAVAEAVEKALAKAPTRLPFCRGKRGWRLRNGYLICPTLTVVPAGDYLATPAPAIP